MRRTIATVLVALMLVLAGCAGGVDSGTTGPNGETTAADGGDGSAGSTGTVNMYVSDERNAIDQFEHLNVTITKVGFQKADTDGDDSDVEAESENETEADDDTEMEADDDTEVEANATVNGSVDANTTGMNVTASADGEVDAEANASAEDGESGDWEEYDVEKKTVDLTKLKGANASALSSLDVEEGNYSKVFVYVDSINATLENGEQVNVKLPSQKLKLNKEFSVESNESVDFVYDITVVTAGNSGKYILKPVVSQSGTSDQVEINVVDDDEDMEAEEDADDAGDDADEAAEDADDAGDDASDAADEAANGLNASFVSEVTAGSNATVSVTQNGSAVANATVTVDGDVVGQTDEDGELTFSVPEGSEEVEVTVTSGENEVELEQTLTATADGSANAKNGNTDDSLTELAA